MFSTTGISRRRLSLRHDLEMLEPRVLLSAAIDTQTPWFAYLDGFVQETVADKQIAAPQQQAASFEQYLSDHLPAWAMQGAPSYLVMQYINDVYHRWWEFVDEAGDIALVAVEQPVYRLLSAAETTALLEASASWAQLVPPEDLQQIVRANDPTLNLPPALGPVDADPLAPVPPAPVGPDTPSQLVFASPQPIASARLQDLSPESVIGTDDRVRITATTGFPWRTIAYLDNRFNDNATFRGTAFLTSPFLALTNAHNVYDPAPNRLWAAQINLSPGQRQDTAGGTVTRPYGRLAANSWTTNQQYIDAITANTTYSGTNHGRFDYAAVFHNNHWGITGQTTFMPLVFGLEPGGVNVAGYPGTVQGITNNFGLWHDFNSVTQTTDRLLRHQADTTPGNSGSPMWQFISPDTRRIAGVHAFGSTTSPFNGGPRLVSQNQTLIGNWMAFIGPDRFEPNNTLAQANNFGSFAGFRQETFLTVHAANNDDYYRFTAAVTGQLDVSILFSHAGGDLDMQLLNAAGTVLASSTSITNNESITFNVTAGTTYYVRVYGFSSATHTNYTLQLGLDVRDTLATAHVTTVGPATGSFAVNERIGNGSFGSRDVDLYRFQAYAGATLTATTSLPTGGQAMDTILRLFDSSGNQLAINDDYPGGGLYSQIVHTFQATGTYYIGVSGFANSSYNPAVANSGIAGSTGDYRIVLGVVDSDVGDTMAAARIVSSGFTSYTNHNPIGNGAFGNRDVDLYRITVSAGDLLTATTSLPPGGQSMDTILRLFDSSGNQIAFNDDFGGSFYSQIRYNFTAGGNYYVGVSGYSNFSYNPAVANSGTAGSTGDYRLTMTREAVPTIIASEFVYETAPQRFTFQFTQNVAASLGTDDLMLQNLTTGTPVPAGFTSVAYDAGTNTATFSFPGYANGILPDGNYRATIIASGVSNAGGTTMFANHIFHTFVLAGDANRDRVVNIGDLATLAGNWQNTGMTFGQGDFNYDGIVNIADLAILAGNWQKTLGIPLVDLLSTPDQVFTEDAKPAPAPGRGNGRAVLSLPPTPSRPVPGLFADERPIPDRLSPLQEDPQEEDKVLVGRGRWPAA